MNSEAKFDSDSNVGLLDRLIFHTPSLPVTKTLIVLNVVIFALMLLFGAGFWHSPNLIQLEWGANFAPATQDGQWWRLFTAMFLHFGVIHLGMNMWALWDCGQLVERMYGRGRFFAIYVTSGLFGNLVSLVAQGNHAVSGGASGAIFSLYGALITFLWRERNEIDPREFRLLYWGAIGFSLITVVMGVLVPGIDNYAHVGGFIAGILTSIVIPKSLKFDHTLPAISNRVMASLFLGLLTAYLLTHLPVPAYRWSDEVKLQQGLQAFYQREAKIQQSWKKILQESQSKEATVIGLADQIKTDVTEPYASSLVILSRLPNNPALPSYRQLEQILQYTEQRKEQSEAAANALEQQASQGLRVPLGADKE